MRVSKLIEILQALHREYGDLEVDTYEHVRGHRVAVRPPEISYRCVLKPSESKPRFANPLTDPDNRIGERVIKIIGEFK